MKTVKLNRFSAKVSASRHIQYSVCHHHIHACGFRTA